jgi:hypothetical protein
MSENNWGITAFSSESINYVVLGLLPFDTFRVLEFGAVARVTKYHGRLIAGFANPCGTSCFSETVHEERGFSGLVAKLQE